MNQRRKPTAGPLAMRLASLSPTRLRPWFRNHLIVAQDNFRRLVKEPIQTSMTVAVIAIALALPAVLLQLSNLGNSIVAGLEVRSDITVFFAPGTASSSVEATAELWRQDRRVASVLLVSPDQGLQDFERYSGLSALIDSLSANPLPWVARVSPDDANLNSPAEQQLLAQSLQAAAGVASVEFDSRWIERLTSFVAALGRLSVSVGLLLGIGVVLVIGNTIRLAIESRRDEIIVIKLVGGTDRFVRRPMLYTGLWYGLAGGILAAVLLAVVGILLGGPLRALFLSYQAVPAELPGLSFKVLLQLIGIGGSFGWLGAYIATTAHLRRIEPT